MAFYMKMGSKSNGISLKTSSGIKMNSPFNKCGDPGEPPCGKEQLVRTIEKDTIIGGKKGIYKTNLYKTIDKIPGTIGDVEEVPPTKTPPKPSGKSNQTFTNPAMPEQTYKEFLAADCGTPGKPCPDPKPAQPSSTPPSSTPPSSTPDTFNVSDRSESSFTPSKPKFSLATPPSATVSTGYSGGASTKDKVGNLISNVGESVKKGVENLTDNVEFFFEPKSARGGKGCGCKKRR